MVQCYICGEEATVHCSLCHEPICETHILAPSGSIKCVLCTDKIYIEVCFGTYVF